MSKNLDLDGYTDEQIVKSLLALPAPKLLAVMTGVSNVLERSTTRGKTLGKRVKAEDNDELMKRLLGEEE